jgi:hypothetical protein
LSSDFVVALYNPNSRLVGAFQDWAFVEEVLDSDPELKSVVIYDTTIEQLLEVDYRTQEWELWTESLSD